MTDERRRVAIVHEHFTQYGGSEWVVEQLCQIWPDAPVYTAVVNRAVLSPRLAGVRFRTTWLQGPFGRARSHLPMLPLMAAAMPTLRVVDADLVVLSHHTYAHRVRVPAGARTLSYVHTPARWMWEPERRREEENRGPVVGAALHSMAATQRSRDRRAARRIDRLLANSRHTAERASRWWGVDAEVLFPPVDTRFFTPDASARREEFYVLAGRLVNHKRPDVVVKAADAAGVRLLVAGDGRARPDLQRLAGPGTTFLGAVPRETLRDLYRRCRAVVFGGEEDFGIVAVEAQACGAPVIGPAVGGLLEGAVDGLTGTFYRPLGDFEVLAGLLRTFDPSRFDPAAMRRHAEGFSAEGFRRGMTTAASELLGAPGG